MVNRILRNPPLNTEGRVRRRNRKTSGALVSLEVSLMRASLLSPHLRQKDGCGHCSGVCLPSPNTIATWSPIAGRYILPGVVLDPHSHASVCLTSHSAITLPNPTIFDLSNIVTHSLFLDLEINNEWEETVPKTTNWGNHDRVLILADIKGKWSRLSSHRPW